MFIKIFLVLDSGMENVIVTWSISGVLIYGVGHGERTGQGTRKRTPWITDIVSHNIKLQV